MNAAFLIATLLAGLPQAPETSFTGTWRMDLATMSPPRLDHFSIANGIFSRGEAPTDLSVRADGVFHTLPPDDYVDAVAVTVTDARHVRERDRFKGKLVYSVDYAVSADGNTLTRKVVDFGKPDGKPIPTTDILHRVGGAPRSGSLLTGTWQSVVTTTTEDHLIEHMTLDGTHFSSSGPGGYGFDAVVGGPAVPVRGDGASARISVSMPDSRTLVEHLFGSGVETGVVTMTLLPGGRSIQESVRWSDGRVETWMLQRR